MRGSIRLGRLFGIPVDMHFTFLLLIAFYAVAEMVSTGSLAAAVGIVLLVLAVFGSVLLHEFGHALTARRFGIRTLDVTLLPIGGLARLERMPSDPKQELLIALAGPAVNVAIAVLLVVLLVFTGVAELALGTSLAHSSFAAQLLAINVGLVLFNMLPAFPMDGGRVLRALLSRRHGHLRATEIASSVGRAMALLIGLAGLWVNPMLVLIAVFVWFGAGQELAYARFMARMATMPPEDDLEMLRRRLWLMAHGSR